MKCFHFSAVDQNEEKSKSKETRIIFIDNLNPTKIEANLRKKLNIFGEIIGS